jgi:hypothetical protein
MSAAETVMGGCADVRVTAAVGGVQLYRHALECIFAFLDLSALASVLRVSGAWHSAVGSMRTAGLERRCPRGRPLADEIAALLSSPSLARHIAAWFQFPPAAGTKADDEWLSAAQLAALTRALPCLRKLRCAVVLSPPAGAAIAAPSIPVLPLPVRLVSLALHLRLVSAMMADVLPAPLSLLSPRSLPCLHTLELSLMSMYLDGRHLDELRALPHLTSLTCTKAAAFEAEQVCDLLGNTDPPTVLPQLEHLGDIELTDDSAAALVAALPGLRSLSVSHCHMMDANKFDFLTRLPLLRTLRLNLDMEARPIAALLTAAAMGHLSRLTDVSVDNFAETIGAGACAGLLAAMPQLRSLCLMWLVMPPSASLLRLPASLVTLELRNCRGLSPAFLAELAALCSSLTSLTLVACSTDAEGDMALTPADMAFLRPPSIALPNLRTLTFEGPGAS